LLVLQGADLLVGIAASPGAAQASVMRSALALRAEENQVLAAACFLLGPNYLGQDNREDLVGQSALLAPISMTPKGDGILVQAGTNHTEGLIAADLDMDELYTLRQTSRFRPREEMHLGNQGQVLADFYQAGLSIEQAIVESGLGPVEEVLEPAPFEPASLDEPLPEIPEPEPPASEPESPFPFVPEALSLTGQGEAEEPKDA
jgi:hypothetical protein